MRAVPRKLVFIPNPESRLEGAVLIDPTYSKDWSPEQMREWAHDVDRMNRTPAAELDRWAVIPPEQLTPEQRRVLDVRSKLTREHESGVNGVLRDDGQVELESGRHRAGYMLEQGVDPVPVWVWAPEQRELDAFEAQCERERPRARAEPGSREPVAREKRRDDNNREGARTRV